MTPDLAHELKIILALLQDKSLENFEQAVLEISRLIDRLEQE